MNMLVDLVPTSVTIDGEKYEINSNFRTSILFELMISDTELSEKQKLEQALKLYYPIIPTNINEAIEKILWFYRCGKDIVEGKGNKTKTNAKIYDYEYDDEYIYSAYLDQYRIDLQDIEDLHWWKFKAMFNSLNEECLFKKIMQWRATDTNKIKDKDQKSFYKNMQKAYGLPVNANKNEEQRFDEINKALLEGNSEELCKLI